MSQESGRHVSESVEMHVDTGGRINECSSDEERFRLLYEALAGELGDDIDIEITIEDDDN
jgi:hypothetical protein